MSTASGGRSERLENKTSGENSASRLGSNPISGPGSAVPVPKMGDARSQEESVLQILPPKGMRIAQPGICSAFSLIVRLLVNYFGHYFTRFLRCCKQEIAISRAGLPRAYFLERRSIGPPGLGSGRHFEKARKGSHLFFRGRIALGVGVRVFCWQGSSSGGVVIARGEQP